MRDLLGEYRAESERMLAFLMPQLDRLEALRDRLQGRERELEARAEEIERERSSLALGRQADAAWDDERREMQAELETAREEVKRLNVAAADVDRLRSKLDGEQAQLGERPAAEQGASREQIEQLELERARLEWELESVRNRAVEMAEVAAQEKRRVAEERAEWSGQLKNLRSTLEQQSQMLANRRPAAEPVQMASAPQAQAGNGGQDPVLQSIMSQFEMLQKDLVRRRGAQGSGARKDGADSRAAGARR